MRTAVRHNSSLRLRCHGLDSQEGHARWRKFHLTELGVLTSQGEQFVVDTQFQFISVQLSARDLELLSRENVALGRQQKLDELVDGHACVDRKKHHPGGALSIEVQVRLRRAGTENAGKVGRQQSS